MNLYRFILVSCVGVASLLACAGPVAQPRAQPSTSTSAALISPLPAFSSLENPCVISNRVYCALNPAVTESTISQTICKSGYTQQIRPPSSFTSELKQRQVAALFPNADPQFFEEDHRMPLELGGAPGSSNLSLDWENVNLSPEVGASPNAKDREETDLHNQVCQHRITLLAAQRKLVADWLDPYPDYKK